MIDKIGAWIIILALMGLLAVGLEYVLATLIEVACLIWKGIKWAVRKVRRRISTTTKN